MAGDKLQVLHAGDISEPTLRSYLGMGLPQLHVLEQPAGSDALPVLSEYLRDAGAQVVLAGSQAETGRVHRRRVAHVLQALPRGQRRRLKVRLPFLATVDNAAPKPRQSAFGPAQRGELAAHEVEIEQDELFTDAVLQPAKPRPKRLKVIKAKSGADRMKAATAKASGGGGQVLKGLSPEAGAEAILKLLIEEGVVR
ncbi:hypothetical protein Ddc_20008 [Ditylenchus destructor]|nr:hypothetical protein Ddc_20008 [Ditylenchus destructor]